MRRLAGRAAAKLRDPRFVRMLQMGVIVIGLQQLGEVIKGFDRRQDELEETMSHYARLEDIARVRHDMLRLWAKDHPGETPAVMVGPAESSVPGDEEPTMVRTEAPEGG